MSHPSLASSSSPAAPRPVGASARADLRQAAPARSGTGGVSAFARVLSDVQDGPLSCPDAAPAVEPAAAVAVDDVAAPVPGRADEHDSATTLTAPLLVDPSIAAAGRDRAQEP